MNKFVLIALITVCLKGIHSAKQSGSINKVPYYEEDKHHTIRGDRGNGDISTDGILLYKNQNNLTKGMVSIKSNDGHQLFVNGKLVLDQDPQQAPIMIDSPDLKAKNISSFEIDILNPEEEEGNIVYTLRV